MSRIKYIYYYDNYFIKWNSRRLNNSTGIATRVAHSLELLIEEFFMTIFTF
jgi:hypothetical protein